MDSEFRTANDNLGILLSLKRFYGTLTSTFFKNILVELFSLKAIFICIN